jgi:hypothetical protein
MDQETKVRENRLRRMAARQGLRLEKNPRRDPLARDFGGYRLTRSNRPVAGGQRYTLADLDAVEAYLTGEQR